MLVTLSLLLAALPLSLCRPPKPPICQTPPPPAVFIPNRAGCHNLVADIYKMAEEEYDEPFIWSTNPPSASAVYRKTPFSYTGPQGTNDCEFLVDALTEGSQDTFPTKLVAQAAESVVQKCMDEGVEGGKETLGGVAVGPKRVFAVILRRLERSRSGVLNTTNVQLLGPGNGSGLNTSNIEGS